MLVPRLPMNGRVSESQLVRNKFSKHVLTEFAGYMDGALRSGERGAREVLMALNRPML